MSERTYLFLMTAEQAEAFSRLAEAGNRGDGDAACRLGDMYREGLGGLRYSPKQTFRWYSRSALAGDVNGQNNLGACYEHGLGCEQSYAKAVKWYRLAAAQQHGTASMNLGYCYLRGKGLPADKEEALRLFRLAVEQGEPKAADELERLGEPAVDSKVTMHRGIRFVDETESGRHFGLVGLGGLAEPVASAGTALGMTPEGATEARMTPERVPLGQLLPGFDKTLVLKSDLTVLKAGFEKFRKRTVGKPYIVTTFRRSIDIDAYPTDSITIGEAFATEDAAAAEAERIHDQICNEFLADTSSSSKWEVVGEEMPCVSNSDLETQEPQFNLRNVKSRMTKLRRNWFDIEYVTVIALELPAGQDPVAAVLGEFYFRPYRPELLSWFENQGRAEKS